MDSVEPLAHRVRHLSLARRGAQETCDQSAAVKQAAVLYTTELGAGHRRDETGEVLYSAAWLKDPPAPRLLLVK
jgi:hypothetical protein